MQVRALGWKVVILGAITVVLMVALMRIGWLVDERQQRQRAAEHGVAMAQAGPQVLLGPLIQRSCKEEWESVSGVGKDLTRSIERRDFVQTATPTELVIDGTLDQAPRYRGLFKVNSYAGSVLFQARWEALAALEPKGLHDGKLSCEEPRVILALSDSRGLRAVTLKQGDDALAVEPGTLDERYPRGLHAVLRGRSLDAPLSLSARITLVGMTDFGIVPAAASTRVKLRSNWPHPSFGGRFLPVSSQVTDDGFEANWQITDLATTAPDDVRRGLAMPILDREPEAEGFTSAMAAERNKGQIADTLAFSMVDPVNPYVMSDRAIKYGLLFIVLTFVSVGMLELLSARRVHPVQYLLVGSAVTLFFLLTLSLSEHLSFGLSYAVASLVATALLTFYGAQILDTRRRGLGFGALMTVLYAVLYVVLDQERAALLVGSLLLFGVLGAVMAMTRHVDWYGLGTPGRRTSRTDAVTAS